jgi:2-polyprenyl-3-methyl-5-hydroxy-6-metoxy-1,4-benzoquinol methylase
MKMKLSVLMPVYNESRTLRTIVKRVLSSPIDMEIELVCVDDGSTDDSLRVLRQLASDDERIVVIAQPRNFGKGRAIRTAIEHMTGDVGIVQDADLEYDPNEYSRVIAPIVNGDADAVYGSRFASSEVRRVLFYWHSLGNKLLTTLSNMANDLNLTDMETCYKAVRADLLKSLRLTSDRFGFEPEITARLAHAGARIYEVPISYYGRTYAEGKNIGWRDGLEALWLVFKFRFLDNKATTDPGHATLESLGAAPSVSRWMLSNFVAHLGDRVFEAGCGSGNLTEHLIDRRKLTVVDIDEAHVRRIHERFGHLENVEVEQGDLQNVDLYERSDGYDSILCVNVLEHLDKPELVVEGFHRMLNPGGHALILVPAHEWLFSDADVALQHRKRYSEVELVEILENAGFDSIAVKQFNRLGVLGWSVNKAMGRTTITKTQARIFGLILPLARVVERIKWLPGLSVVAIARKS